MAASDIKTTMKYLISPSEYLLPNPRIDGFRKLKEINAKTVDISVFSLETFQYFFKYRELPLEFIEELKNKAKEIIDTTLTHAAVVRRAFVVPGLENPPGPYFLGLTTSQAVVDAVTKLYNFAISQDYYKSQNSQISGFIYPFIDPEKYNKKNPNVSAIPYGGYAIFESNKVEVYSVFGNNEGVQSLVADRYEVKSRGNGRLLIIKKEVPQKNLMYCTTEDSERDQVQVPIELQFEQVLVDNEILEVGRVLFELSDKYGPQRIEFTADQSGLIFNEAADYWKETRQEENQNINIKGVVRVINSVSDFDKLLLIPNADLISGRIIVKVGENIIVNRDYDVLGALAAWKDNLFVLYPGVAATQHAMRVLTDKGHKAFLVGNLKFEEDDEVQIVVAGGKVRVTNHSSNQNPRYASLWDASLLGVGLCGGKADRLSKLKISGYQVPHGTVCTTVLFDEVLEKVGYKTSITLAQFSEIYEILKSPSEEILSSVNTLLIDYVKSDKLFSTRSSATIEDDSKDSMAGMFETYLNVSGKELAPKIIQVIRSAFAPKIAQYLEKNSNLLEKLKMAVVLQEMISARCAGVIFGAKIQTGDLNVVEIETNCGLGEKIVSGEAKEVEQYKFSRNEQRVVERKGPEILSLPEAKALFMLSERLRSEFGDIPQDIEWAIDTDKQIWVFQSRDLILAK
jgi:hypothetical protein